MVRWIGVLPVGFIAGWLAWVAVFYGNQLTGIVEIGSFFPITAAAIAQGFAFVYAGARIAPTHRIQVALGLGGLEIFIMGMGLGATIIAGDGWSMWQLVCAAGGAGCAVYAIHSGKISVTN